MRLLIVFVIIWYKWKEIIAAFDHHARFLPRNLVDDFCFSSWKEVLLFYEEKEHWFLHEQMESELKEIFSDVSLSEWDAFCFYMAPSKRTPPELKPSPELKKRFKEIVELTRQKQNDISFMDK